MSTTREHGDDPCGMVSFKMCHFVSISTVQLTEVTSPVFLSCQEMMQKPVEMNNVTTVLYISTLLTSYLNGADLSMKQSFL